MKVNPEVEIAFLTGNFQDKYDLMAQFSKEQVEKYFWICLHIEIGIYTPMAV